MRSWSLLFCILLPATCVAADTVLLPERDVFELGGYAIEYSEEDEAFARALLERLVPELAKIAPQPPVVPVGLDTLRAEREAFLSEIARYLALKEPTERMSWAYDTFINGSGALMADMLGSIDSHRLALWRKAEILARLDAGETVPNFSRGEEDKVTWSFNAHVAGEGDQVLKTDMASAIALPIVLTEEDTEVGEGLMERKANEVLKLMQGMAEGLGPFNTVEQVVCFVVLHEAVEITLFQDISLKSKDRRWFCDGVANYLAHKIIEDRVGPEEAKHYYYLEEQLAQYEDVKKRINLAAWPAAENLPKPMSAKQERLNKAHYPFATEVIAKACSKHGDDLLPRLFREIQRAPPEERNMRTVYRAYRRLTGEDLRRYFPNRPPWWRRLGSRLGIR